MKEKRPIISELVSQVLFFLGALGAVVSLALFIVVAFIFLSSNNTGVTAAIIAFSSCLSATLMFLFMSQVLRLLIRLTDSGPNTQVVTSRPTPKKQRKRDQSIDAMASLDQQ